MNPDATSQLSCPACGYDVRGLREAKCPECGNTFDPNKIERQMSLAEKMARLVLVIAGGFVSATLATLPCAMAMHTRDGKWWSPWGIPAILCCLPVSNWWGATIGSVVFYVVGTRLWTPYERVPRGALVLALLTAALSAIYLSYCILTGVRDFGPVFIWGVVLMNAGICAALVVLWRWSLARGDFWIHVVFETLFCAWIFTYAFPLMAHIE